MGVWKIIFLSKLVICMFDVNLPWCKLTVGFREGITPNYPLIGPFIGVDKAIYRGFTHCFFFQYSPVT